ncbi:hypothetical protein DN826_14685 [Stutzerimonas nosocomialis]|uniref:HNH/endonuclease VII fold putative polymorphic toxin n=1 Tax=Stutzerimonas nosocomialis TaxID=1056496 RepID=UPI0011081499|nr:HNH/endonuclease VII fold putative polymorphic toxin [Stutzerimonas nosocomialis]TLX54282.1 hypothetical protein DN826_14685 [Stutzerimonas nosocomialis]
MIATQADKYNRQLHSDEAAFLQELALGDPERAGAWDAAACALVRCSQGVPVSDQRYAELAALEAKGAQYPEFQAALKQTGLFTYSSSENIADAISRNGQELYYAGAWGSVLGGAGGAVFSGLGGVGSCGVTLGLGCAGAVVGVAGGVDQFNDGLARAFAAYQSTEGQRVLASFRPDSHMGDTSLWYGLGDLALTQAADIALSKLGGKLVGKVDGSLASIISPSKPGRSGALNDAKKDLGIPKAQHPEAVNHVPMTDLNGKAILGSDGRRIMTREYVYARPDGSKVIIQEHSVGQGGVGDQGPHFNVRPPENPRTGSVADTKDHYSW